MNKLLIAVAKEFNIGTGTIVEYLTDKGFEIQNRPLAKVNEAMYNELIKKFSDSKILKDKAHTYKKIEII